MQDNDLPQIGHKSGCVTINCAGCGSDFYSTDYSGNHPSDCEAGKGDASGFDLVGAIVQHMSDDLGFVVGQMPNEDQQRFYRLRDKAREWLIAEGSRLDAILALSGSLAPEGGSPSCASGHANYIGKCPYCHEKLPGIPAQADKQGDA